MLNYFTLYAIIIWGSQSAGWFPSPKGGGSMSTYERLSIFLQTVVIIATLVMYVIDHNGTKK